MIIPSVPSIPSDIDPQLWQVLNAIKVNIDYVQANPSTSNGVDQAQLATAVSNAIAGITTGATGEPGTPGANAPVYVLDITGGRTSVIYDATGANPLPTMTPFTAVLYKDGAPFTGVILYNWYIAHPATSLLSSTSSTDSFAPTLASTFDATKPDNSVSLSVSADGFVFNAVEPIAITKIGATGANGDNGSNGVSLYTWLKYADTPTTGMSNLPAGKTYMGIAYNKSVIIESLDYADYDWSLITGTDGLRGTDGVTKYTWVKYATNNDGTTGFSDSPTGRAYIGLAFNKDTATESNTPTDYAWSLIQGATGVSGTRTAVLDVYKYSLAAPTTFPSGVSTYTWATGQFEVASVTLNGWSVVPPSPVLGQTLWIARTLYADNDTALTTAITWTATTALPLAMSGANGRRTAQLQLFQWASATPTTFPSGDSVYTWETGLFTTTAVTLNSWTVAVGTGTLGQILYTCYANYSDDLLTATSTISWPASNSALPAGAAGANGQRIGILEVYQWASSAPTPPSGTSDYTWATGAFTAPSTANGWSLLPGASSPGLTLWGIRTTISNNLSDASSVATWSSTTPYAVGSAGSDGLNGKTYLLFIIGGKTNAIYDTDGLNPTPAQTDFACELYENGTLVTPTTYAWSVPAANSLLTGTATTATFTPVLATSYNSAYGDNRVMLTVTYVVGGITFTLKAVQPIAISKQTLATVDTTPPAAIGGTLDVIPGTLYNYLTWGALPANFDHVEIWRSTSNDRNGLGTDADPLGATLIGTSVFTLYLDYIPDGVGVTNYYWIRAISKAGIKGFWNATSSSGRSAAATGIGDAQMGTISASKIVAASLAAITANLGNVTAGALSSGDNMFIIDLVNKSIIMGSAETNPGSVPNWYGAKYIHVTAGTINTYQWNGATYEPASSLRLIETGVGTNGAVKTLSKYYSSQPQIIVSPANLRCFNGANPTQNQTLIISAQSISVVNGVCRFTPTAYLALSANVSTVTLVSNTLNAAIDTAQTTPQQVTQASSIGITCALNVVSTKGTGLSATGYYVRQVRVRIGYRLSATTGAYNYTGYDVTTRLSADSATNSITASVAGLAANTYYFVVEYTTSNVTVAPLTWIPGGATYTDYIDTVAMTADSFPPRMGNKNNGGYGISRHIWRCSKSSGRGCSECYLHNIL